MSGVHFTATRLVGTGKKGILLPDADGYYTMPIGGLNVFNSVKQYYALEGAEKLFQESSVFMRRVRGGNLKGEVGHPKKLPGMTDDEFIERVVTIEETNICCHFADIWLDADFGKNNPELKNPALVAIMAKVKPSGAKGAFLKEMFDNSQENLCFSIRAQTRNYYERGQCIRVLSHIFTFDHVNEPGIFHANKWASPALEGLEETVVNSKAVHRVADKASIFATEDSRVLARELKMAMEEHDKGQRRGGSSSVPLYQKW
jgi:Peptidase S80 family